MAVEIKSQRSNVTLAPRDLRRLFSASSSLTDLLEDILEERADYNPGFLRTLQKSLKDVREGRVYPISSLADI